LPRDEEWAQAFTLIRAWEIEPVALGNLRSLANDEIPQAILEQASHKETTSRAEALKLSLLTGQIFSRFEAAGIQSIVLKGAATGAIAYDDVTLRTFGDIDLLVRAEDSASARDILLGTGYTRQYDAQNEALLLSGGHALEFNGVGCHVEVHTTLIEKHLGLGLKERDVFESAHMVDCAGVAVRAMGRSELLIFLSAHGAKHEWLRLRWIVDVAQLIDRMDEREIGRSCEIARRIHALRILAMAVTLARDVLGQNVESFPPDVTQSSISDVEEMVIHQLGLGPVTNSLPVSRLDAGLKSLIFWARVRDRLLDRIAPFAHVLFVPTEKDSGRRMTWVTRPVRILARMIRGK
jgi:hypothetical protein